MLIGFYLRKPCGFSSRLPFFIKTSTSRAEVVACIIAVSGGFYSFWLKREFCSNLRQASIFFWLKISHIQLEFDCFSAHLQSGRSSRVQHAGRWSSESVSRLNLQLGLSPCWLIVVYWDKVHLLCPSELSPRPVSLTSVVCGAIKRLRGHRSAPRSVPYEPVAKPAGLFAPR